MRERLLSYIRRYDLMRPGDRVGVAVSGGADSVALLRLLLEAHAELGIVLSVVHLNHKIRGADAEADETFVRELATQFDLEYFSDCADTLAYAAEHKLSLEAAGRELRYRFFDALTGERVLNRIATAHTRDDQAETVLLRLLRGSGTRGLAGIYPAIGGWISVALSIRRSGDPVPPTPPAPTGFRIVRPLLEVSRTDLRTYLQEIGQPWREDASNQDLSFTRNRLRHEIMPLLRQLNPNLDAVLSETADIARAEEHWWERIVTDAQAGVWKPKPTPDSRPEPRIKLERLRDEPLAVQRRVLRRFGLAYGLRLEFQHVEQLLELAAESSQAVRRVELPQDCDAVRAGQELWIERRRHIPEPHDYDLALPVPGELAIPQAGLTISADVTTTGERLDPTWAGDLRVRNWRPGDRYQPAHTAEPKKLKELLLARHIPREYKPGWPVVIARLSPDAGETALSVEEAIVWVPGFSLPERFRLRESGTEGVRLTQLPLQNHAETGP